MVFLEEMRLRPSISRERESFGRRVMEIEREREDERRRRSEFLV